MTDARCHRCRTQVGLTSNRKISLRSAIGMNSSGIAFALGPLASPGRIIVCGMGVAGGENIGLTAREGLKSLRASSVAVGSETGAPRRSGDKLKFASWAVTLSLTKLSRVFSQSVGQLALKYSTGPTDAATRNKMNRKCLLNMSNRVVLDSYLLGIGIRYAKRRVEYDGRTTLPCRGFDIFV